MLLRRGDKRGKSEAHGGVGGEGTEAHGGVGGEGTEAHGELGGYRGKADIHGSTSCRFIACNSNEYG